VGPPSISSSGVTTPRFWTVSFDQSACSFAPTCHRPGGRAGGDRGTSEHVADPASIEKAAADITREQRQVARPTAGYDTDLALIGSRRSDDAVAGSILPQLGVGGAQTFKHLARESVWRVHQLLHWITSAYPLTAPETTPRMK
jgi:hypothetical protein